MGGEKDTFTVHEDVLFDASPFFKAAFQSQFKEATDRSITLAEDHADVVEQFLRWIYLHTVDLSASDGKDGQLIMDMNVDFAARLYIFANKCQVEGLQAEICEAMFKIPLKAKWLPPSSFAVAHVYGNTLQYDLLRWILKDWFVWAVNPSFHMAVENRVWLHSIPDLSMLVTAYLAGRASFKSWKNPCELDYTEYVRKSVVRTGEVADG